MPGAVSFCTLRSTRTRRKGWRARTNDARQLSSWPRDQVRARRSASSEDRRMPEGPAGAIRSSFRLTATGRRLAASVLAASSAWPCSPLAIYYPAWHGGPLWDDDAHLTQAGAAVARRPLAHLVRRRRDAAVLPGRAFGVLADAPAVGRRDPRLSPRQHPAPRRTSAFLIGLILRRLAIPGAWLAALLFARPSRPRRVRGVDDRAEEHAVGCCCISVRRCCTCDSIPAGRRGCTAPRWCSLSSRCCPRA